MNFNYFENESSANSGLLSDVNVLDLSRILAGPICTMTLGDLGANIIKVESLNGDEARKWGPPFINGNKDSYYFVSANRNKKSICIDLKTEEGKKLIYDLARKCDVVVENFIPGKLDKLDIGYEKLKVINPKLIYCAITGFGSTGPYNKKPGYDIVASAMSGLMNSTGERNGDPVKTGVPIADITTGLQAFGAIMTALYVRQKTGKGQKIDCNLLSTQIGCMFNVASMYLNCGIEGQRWGTAHANIVPYQAFKTQDGYMVIGTGSNAQFADFCKVVGREDLIADEMFKDNSKRIENRETITEIISDIIIKKSTKEWIEIFKGVSFPNGPINKMKDVFEDEHVKAIGLVKELFHPDAGTVKVVGPSTVYELGGNDARTAPPTLGQHTRDILANFLGYHDHKIDELFEGSHLYDMRETDKNLTSIWSSYVDPTVSSLAERHRQKREKNAKKLREPRVAVLTLRAPRAAQRKKVVWTEDTVDNEHMNKKKSKCCCIYEKPHKFGDSDSEDSDDECEHCSGHVEKRKAKKAGAQQTTEATQPAALTIQEEPQPPEQTATITLQPSEPVPAPAPPDRDGDTAQCAV